jgi:Protein of unknown function (DUF5818)
MMLRSFLRRILLAALVTLVAVVWGSSAQARQSSAQQRQNEGQIPASGNATTQEAKSFSGNIVRDNHELVLKDPVTKVIYKLDHSEKAKPYVGKRVKVRGRLDMDSNTILVETIEVAM